MDIDGLLLLDYFAGVQEDLSSDLALGGLVGDGEGYVPVLVIHVVGVFQVHKVSGGDDQDLFVGQVVQAEIVGIELQHPELVDIGVYLFLEGIVIQHL